MFLILVRSVHQYWKNVNIHRGKITNLPGPTDLVWPWKATFLQHNLCQSTPTHGRKHQLLEWLLLLQQKCRKLLLEYNHLDLQLAHNVKSFLCLQLAYKGEKKVSVRAQYKRLWQKNALHKTKHRLCRQHYSYTVLSISPLSVSLQKVASSHTKYFT